MNNRLADFIYEVGMLRHTPRNGWRLLGTNSESIAEHSYRTAVIGYILAKKADADIKEVLLLTLFHDLHEARTGDFDYLNHKYDSLNAKSALQDAIIGTGLDEIVEFYSSFCVDDTIEARLARDADQIDFIANLCVEKHRGNAFAGEWLENALKRLVTNEGKELAKALLATNPDNWWYYRINQSWWEKRK